MGVVAREVGPVKSWVPIGGQPNSSGDTHAGSGGVVIANAGLSHSRYPDPNKTSADSDSPPTIDTQISRNKGSGGEEAEPSSEM